MFRWPERLLTVILAYGLVFIGLPVLCACPIYGSAARFDRAGSSRPVHHNKTKRDLNHDIASRRDRPWRLHRSFGRRRHDRLSQGEKSAIVDRRLRERLLARSASAWRFPAALKDFNSLGWSPCF